MARHWSAFCNVSQSQGIALDRMAKNHGKGDGMSLLMELTGCSRSRVGKMDYASLRPYLDEAFELYSGDPPKAPAPAAPVAAPTSLIEPPYLPHLRVIGGIAGMLHSHAEGVERGDIVTAETLHRLADRLNAEQIALSHTLNGSNP
jgi:hypothetical protein